MSLWIRAAGLAPQQPEPKVCLLSTCVGGPAIFAESFRHLRTSLECVAGSARTIMVCSPSPREGKSTVAANLGLAWASRRKNVLLVDCDMRHPVQHLNFSMPNVAGLSTMLEHRNHNNLHVQQTVPGLDLLTSGPLPPSPPDELASDTMAVFVEFAKTRYDIVILDSPPVLTTSDATILARMADGILLVVKAGHTRREQAADAIKRLRRANPNLMGVVFNGLVDRGALKRAESYRTPADNNLADKLERVVEEALPNDPAPAPEPAPAEAAPAEAPPAAAAPAQGRKRRPPIRKKPQTGAKPNARRRTDRTKTA